PGICIAPSKKSHQSLEAPELECSPLPEPRIAGSYPRRHLMAAKAKARTKAKPKARSKTRSGGKAVRAGAGGRPDSTRTAKGNGQPRDLPSRLAAGAVVCAEGYVFELEPHGYFQAAAVVPEVPFTNPQAAGPQH